MSEAVPSSLQRPQNAQISPLRTVSRSTSSPQGTRCTFQKCSPTAKNSTPLEEWRHLFSDFAAPCGVRKFANLSNALPAPSKEKRATRAGLDGRWLNEINKRPIPTTSMQNDARERTASTCSQSRISGNIVRSMAARNGTHKSLSIGFGQRSCWKLVHSSF